VTIDLWRQRILRRAAIAHEAVLFRFDVCYLSVFTGTERNTNAKM
jgi:hypothetical protein